MALNNMNSPMFNSSSILTKRRSSLHLCPSLSPSPPPTKHRLTTSSDDEEICPVRQRRLFRGLANKQADIASEVCGAEALLDNLEPPVDTHRPSHIEGTPQLKSGIEGPSISLVDIETFPGELGPHPPICNMRGRSVSEILPGLSDSDLAMSLEGKQHDLIEYYLDYEPHRALEWRLAWQGQAKRRGKHWKIEKDYALRAAFTQTRGRFAKVPCTECDAGNGPWESCVVDDECPWNNKLSDGDCGNCRFTGSYDCNHRIDRILKDSRPRRAGETPDKPKTRVNKRSRQRKENTPAASSTRVSPAQDDKDSLIYAAERDIEVSSFVRQSKEKYDSSARNSPDPAVIVTRVHATEPDIQPHSASQQPEAKPLCKEDIDGKFLPFPVGEDKYNDLSFLKRAIVDQKRHLAAVQMRIRELEQEEMEKSMGNPWNRILKSLEE
ncbi:hypothetical protein BJY04DRAFT_216239 [Aspergillus karnatakaensis]|uniref:DUF3716 domain-containing protein n=1 Tax=Aspergillus karnatakaensis TaxID=1810916 RepID=UPI003CCD3367